MLITILETKDINEFLEKRNLIFQYKKVKKFILGSPNIFRKLKKRKPKNEGIYQFRINKQYRAFCYFDEIEKNTIIVFDINDHQ